MYPPVRKKTFTLIFVRFFVYLHSPAHHIAFPRLSSTSTRPVPLVCLHERWWSCPGNVILATSRLCVGHHSLRRTLAFDCVVEAHFMCVSLCSVSNTMFTRHISVIWFPLRLWHRAVFSLPTPTHPSFEAQFSYGVRCSVTGGSRRRESQYVSLRRSRCVSYEMAPRAMERCSSYSFSLAHPHTSFVQVGVV